MIYQKKMCIILPLLGQQLTVMKIDKKNHLQVYLEECKYKVKKNANVWIHKQWTKSDSDSSDSELDSEKIGSKIDGKLIAKLESGSDSK